MYYSAAPGHAGTPALAENPVKHFLGSGADFWVCRWIYAGRILQLGTGFFENPVKSYFGDFSIRETVLKNIVIHCIFL